jgi:hypothetical protein
MVRRIATVEKVDSVIQNRTKVSWNPKLLSTKSKPKAEAFASTQESLQEIPSHCLPKHKSGKVTDKQANAGFALGASWDELEAELDRRMNGALDEPIFSAWRELEVELEKRMNGSMKHLHASRSALWGENEAEIERQMTKLLKDLNASRSIPTDEKETHLSSKKGESQSSSREAPKEECESPGCSQNRQQPCQKTLVKSDATTQNSTKGPPLGKKQKKPQMGVFLRVQKWKNKSNKADSKPLVSTSSSTEIGNNTSFDSKSSTKHLLCLKSLNLIKSTNIDQKGSNPLTEIEISSGETKRLRRKEGEPAVNPSRPSKEDPSQPSKEESWLQRTIKDRDQTWLKQVQLAIEDAKKNTKSSEQFDDICSTFSISGSVTFAVSETSSDSESDCSDNAYTFPRTDTRITNDMARDVIVVGDGIGNLFRQLTCSETMIETEPDMSRWDPRPLGLVVGGKKVCVLENYGWRRPSMFHSASRPNRSFSRPLVFHQE